MFFCIFQKRYTTFTHLSVALIQQIFLKSKCFSQYTLALQKYSIVPYNSPTDKPKKTLGGVKT